MLSSLSQRAAGHSSFKRIMTRACGLGGLRLSSFEVYFNANLLRLLSMNQRCELQANFLKVFFFFTGDYVGEYYRVY